MRGHAAPELIESFEVERLSADRQVLEVSDQLHALAHGAVESARTGIRTPPPPPDAAAALLRSRCMLDVSYAESALVASTLQTEPGRLRILRPGPATPVATR